jgi:NADPH-dependent curcumin reductase CurA
VPGDFRQEEVAVPPLGAGEILLKTVFLSLDPYMRGRMSDGPSYVEPLALGETMCGQAMCQVEQSNDPAFQPGDRVLANVGWQDYGVSLGAELTKLDAGLEHPSYALGVLGMPGLTAYVGLLDIGQPKSGETLVVASATGAVGSAVGQIAKLKGCRVVGVAGGHDKCEYAVKELGFDACIDHHDENFASMLAQSCPRGIDIYYENVGGAVFDAVLPLLNVHARIPLCGLVAFYNLAALPIGVDHTPMLMRAFLVRRVKVQGFIIFDHYDRLPAFTRDMTAWLDAGRIRYREDIIDGLENAPAALIGLLRGDNFGKVVVRVPSH